MRTHTHPQAREDTHIHTNSMTFSPPISLVSLSYPDAEMKHLFHILSIIQITNELIELRCSFKLRYKSPPGPLALVVDTCGHKTHTHTHTRAQARTCVQATWSACHYELDPLPRFCREKTSESNKQHLCDLCVWVWVRVRARLCARVHGCVPVYLFICAGTASPAIEAAVKTTYV